MPDVQSRSMGLGMIDSALDTACPQYIDASSRWKYGRRVAPAHRLVEFLLSSKDVQD